MLHVGPEVEDLGSHLHHQMHAHHSTWVSADAVAAVEAVQEVAATTVTIMDPWPAVAYPILSAQPCPVFQHHSVPDHPTDP